MYRFQHHAQFFTATNLNWLPIFENDYHKQILLEALKHRVDKDKVTIYAFVIIPNHFHVCLSDTHLAGIVRYKKDFRHVHCSER